MRTRVNTIVLNVHFRPQGGETSPLLLGLSFILFSISSIGGPLLSVDFAGPSCRLPLAYMQLLLCSFSVRIQEALPVPYDSKLFPDCGNQSAEHFTAPFPSKAHRGIHCTLPRGDTLQGCTSRIKS